MGGGSDVVTVGVGIVVVWWWRRDLTMTHAFGQSITRVRDLVGQWPANQSIHSFITPLGSEAPPKLGTPAYKTNEQVLQMNRRQSYDELGGEHNAKTSKHYTSEPPQSYESWAVINKQSII